MLNDTREIYGQELKNKYVSIYWLILLMLVISFVSLPFIKLDISVKSAGIIRPKDEKTVLKSAINTVIDTIYFKEGDRVTKGDIVIQLRKENIAIKRSLNDFEIRQRNQFIADLAILTRQTSFTGVIMEMLQSPLYKQQCSRFIFQLSELGAQQKKVTKELYMDSVLSIDRVIAPKELFDKQIECEKLVANILATKEQQVAGWQQELARYQLEKSQFENANQQLNEDSNFYSIRAPVNGVLQNFNNYYSGSLVQSGESLAVITPDAAFIVECYINTRDVGLLKQFQHTIFQVDAFDYNYFGVLTGSILSIDNDFILMENKPVFKVRCLLDNTQLQLKNGFTGNIKKGMTLQARFVVTQRSLWQLLFDKIDDWVNPALFN